MQNHAKFASVGKYSFLHYCKKVQIESVKKMFPVSFLSGRSLEYIQSLGITIGILREKERPSQGMVVTFVYI